MKLDLTKNEARAVAEVLESAAQKTFIGDAGINSLIDLRQLIHAYEKLALYGGYEPFIDNVDDLPERMPQYLCGSCAECTFFDTKCGYCRIKSQFSPDGWCRHAELRTEDNGEE